VKYFKAGSNWLNLGGVPELGKGGRVDSTSHIRAFSPVI
jgi:hypothetical protein